MHFQRYQTGEEKSCKVTGQDGDGTELSGYNGSQLLQCLAIEEVGVQFVPPSPSLVLQPLKGQVVIA